MNIHIDKDDIDTVYKLNRNGKLKSDIKHIPFLKPQSMHYNQMQWSDESAKTLGNNSANMHTGRNLKTMNVGWMPEIVKDQAVLCLKMIETHGITWWITRRLENLLAGKFT